MNYIASFELKYNFTFYNNISNIISNNLISIKNWYRNLINITNTLIFKFYTSRSFIYFFQISGSKLFVNSNCKTNNSITQLLLICHKFWAFPFLVLKNYITFSVFSVANIFVLLIIFRCLRCYRWLIFLYCKLLFGALDVFGG